MSHSLTKEENKDMSNTQRYASEINHSDDYRISIKSFKNWLSTENMTEVFNEKLRNSELTEFDIAVDFSIPVAMVKHFRQTA